MEECRIRRASAADEANIMEFLKKLVYLLYNMYILYVILKNLYLGGNIMYEHFKSDVHIFSNDITDNINPNIFIKL